MVLSHKTASELLTREGKEKLAKEIMRESVRPMGIELDDEDEPPAGGEAPKKKKKKKAAVESPVTQVLFSNFIVQ
jgi:flagellar FliL protein